MPWLNLAQFVAISNEGGFSGNRAMSDKSTLLLLDLISQPPDYGLWFDYPETMTEAEKLQIDGFYETAFKELITDLPPVTNPLSNVYIHPWEFRPLIGTINKATTGSSVAGFFSFNTSQNDGDTWVCDVSLALHFYELRILHWKGTVGGLIQPAIIYPDTSVQLLQTFSSYVASGGGYDYTHTQTFTPNSAFDRGQLRLVCSRDFTGPTSAKTMTIQDIVISRT